MSALATQEDFVERHVDAIAGLGAIAWAVSAVTWLPQLAVIVSPEAAAVFVIPAFVRWWRKIEARRKAREGAPTA